MHSGTKTRPRDHWSESAYGLTPGWILTNFDYWPIFLAQKTKKLAYLTVKVSLCHCFMFGGWFMHTLKYSKISWELNQGRSRRQETGFVVTYVGTWSETTNNFVPLWLSRRLSLVDAEPKTYASEKVPVTKEFTSDDFPTARNPRNAILRWTTVGLLLLLLLIVQCMENFCE